LERRGHHVLTVDLPCEDSNAGAADYAEAALKAPDRLAENLVGAD
jgi:hypothetical protein